MGEGCVGVDLNRNFGYEWGGVLLDIDPCEEVYPGEEAYSEKEAQNIRDWFLSFDAVPELAVCFHRYKNFSRLSVQDIAFSAAELWLYPYGYDIAPVPDNIVEVVSHIVVKQTCATLFTL